MQAHRRPKADRINAHRDRRIETEVDFGDLSGKLPIQPRPTNFSGTFEVNRRRTRRNFPCQVMVSDELLALAASRM